MKKYLVLVVMALSLVMVGCTPKEEPAPDTPDKAATENAGLEGEATAEAK